MMKFIGIMLIFLSGTLCGTSAAAGLLRRTRRLQSIELMLTEINTEIKFCRKNLLQIFCDMKTRQSYLNLGFLSTLDTDECDSFEKLWSYSIENEVTSLYHLCHICCLSNSCSASSGTALFLWSSRFWLLAFFFVPIYKLSKACIWKLIRDTDWAICATDWLICD